jgi:hypothetical protein
VDTVLVEEMEELGLVSIVMLQVVVMVILTMLPQGVEVVADMLMLLPQLVVADQVVAHTIMLDY